MKFAPVPSTTTWSQMLLVPPSTVPRGKDSLGTTALTPVAVHVRLDTLATVTPLGSAKYTPFVLQGNTKRLLEMPPAIEHVSNVQLPLGANAVLQAAHPIQIVNNGNTKRMLELLPVTRSALVMCVHALVGRLQMTQIVPHTIKTSAKVAAPQGAYTIPHHECAIARQASGCLVISVFNALLDLGAFRILQPVIYVFLDMAWMQQQLGPVHSV